MKVTTVLTLNETRKQTLVRALQLAYRSSIDTEFRGDLDKWLSELGVEER